MKDILDKCLAEHSAVTAYDGIFGGTPHLKDRRFSVGDVLARIFTEGSIGAVSEAYGIPEAELKCALAFAQDFIEDAFHRIIAQEREVG
jgi:uncharacterized protein (DUF433 family)